MEALRTSLDMRLHTVRGCSDDIFTRPQGVSRAWGALDDVVMGGRSESGFELRPGAGEDGGSAGVFSGMVGFRG